MTQLTQVADVGDRSRRIARMAVILGLAFFVVGLIGQQADAAVRYGVSGSPGTMSLGDSYGANYCSTITLCEAAIYTEPKTVTESYPYRSQYQYVCITTRFWHDGGSTAPGAGVWTKVDQATDCKWISPSATSTRIQGRILPVMSVGRLRGDWATDFVVTWRLQNGTQIGKATYDYVHTSDYACYQIALVSCTVTGSAVGNDAGIRLWA